MVSGFVFKEMGCKRTGSSQEEKNLQAALDLIIHQGYYGTSIKGITARVGISKALYTFEHKVWIGTVGIVAIFHVYIQRTEQRP